MGVGGASPTAGASCATCLRKFTVHFRHNEKDFDGGYGFDWLRNEYVNNLKKVDGISYKNTFRGNISDLLAIYSEGQKTLIRPYGYNYIPAWLAIFPKTTSKQSASGSQEINKNGVDLDLEIVQLSSDEKDPLTSDGTSIELLATSDFIKLTPSKFDIKQLINNRKSREIDKTNNKNEFFYENKKIINIKCEGGALNQHEEINVFAVKNGVREKVGKLMLYKNNDIPKLELNFIDVISDNNSLVKPSSYEYYLKFKSYNQALIRAEKRLETKFDLLDLAKKNEDVADFLAEVASNKQLDIDYLANRFVNLFDKYGGKYRPIEDKKYLNINDDGHTRTYIFYTNISAGNVNGYAPSRMEGRRMKWGNAIVVFKQAHTRLDVLVHEIGHSLGLPHVFEKNNNKFVFYQGQSGNLMDYTWFYAKSKQVDSKITRKYFSKFQWDILRSDRSLK